MTSPIKSFETLLETGLSILNLSPDKIVRDKIILWLVSYIKSMENIVLSYKNLGLLSDNIFKKMSNVYLQCETVKSLSNEEKFDYSVMSNRLNSMSMEANKESIDRLFFQGSVIKSISERFTNIDIILSNLHKRDNKKIIVTMTSCKRFDLMMSTIKSFVACCLDLYRVDKFIIIDDNSSKSDRKRMFTELDSDFFQIILKNESDKGHSKSMNILKKEIEKSGCQYFLHLEDDWKFVYKDNYISKAIKVLETNDKYGQCLFNKSYSEEGELYKVTGGIKKVIKDMSSIPDITYFEHEYYQGDDLKKWEDKNMGKNGIAHHVYWPHFSFRVGVTKSSVLKKVGDFNKVDHFEMDYAKRYTASGYITTYLNATYCVHSGRKTWERDDKSIANAYTLNKEVQFSSKEEKQFSSKDPNELPVVLENTPNNLKAVSYVINLKRRPDRLKKFVDTNEHAIKALLPEIYYGTDGKLLEPENKILKLFETGDFNYRKGIMGCALSHINIWMDVITNKLSTDIAIVFEDDAIIDPNINVNLPRIIKLLPRLEEWDILYLGNFLYDEKETKKEHVLFTDSSQSGVELSINKWTTADEIKKNMGGTHGYIINRFGAMKLLDHVKHFGVYNGIDWVMFKSGISKYHSSPHLVIAPLANDNKIVDSDIQHSRENFGIITLEYRLEMELKYWAQTLEISNYKNQTDKKIVSTLKQVKFSQISFIEPNTDIPLKELLDQVTIIYSKGPIESFKKIGEKYKKQSPFLHWYSIISSTDARSTDARSTDTRSTDKNTFECFIFIIPDTFFKGNRKRFTLNEFYIGPTFFD